MPLPILRHPNLRGSIAVGLLLLGVVALIGGLFWLLPAAPTLLPR